tara:strand:- start:184 stop:294 length:111 start_codon:yes stop_codon:yes gene_type:complete
MFLINILAFSSFKVEKVTGATINEKKSIIPKIIQER